jgi:hypothetical protein
MDFEETVSGLAVSGACKQCGDACLHALLLTDGRDFVEVALALPRLWSMQAIRLGRLHALLATNANG